MIKPPSGAPASPVDGEAPYPKTKRLLVPLTAPALAAVEALPPRVDTPLIFPASQGGHIGLDTWRTREWYPSARGGRTQQTGPVRATAHLRDRALAAGVSTFELARLMGTSVAMIDRTLRVISLEIPRT